MFRWMFLAMACVLLLVGATMLANGITLNGAGTLAAAVLFGFASELIAQNRHMPELPA